MSRGASRKLLGNDWKKRDAAAHQPADTCDVCGNDTPEPKTDDLGQVYCPSCWHKFKEGGIPP